MQIVPFSTLLASLLVALVLVNQSVAAPVRRAPALATLPVKRIKARSDVHPQVLLQQHINRGVRRLARMAGRAEPKTHELREALHKRLFFLENGAASAQLEKRYNRQGVPSITSDSKAVANDLAQAIPSITTTNDAPLLFGATSTINPTSLETGVVANSGGVSPLEIEAAQNGGLTNAEPPTADNSLGLAIEANDVGYVATVQMGTPPQNFNILMDSGSADLWVGAEGCQSQQGGDCGNHQFLGPQSSSTFVASNDQFEVQYGSGAVAGTIVTDNVNIAGLQLNTHTFGVALLESVQFSSDSVAFDGLMGLAQSTLSEQGVLTPVESLAKAGLIQDAITSYRLGRVADGSNDGEVTFGGLDPTKFEQNTLTTIDNVNTQGFWEGALDNVLVNGQNVGLNGRTAILDTGTTLIIAPDADAIAIHEQIPGAQSDGQGGFTVPCTSTAIVALTFGGTTFNINPQDIAFQPVDINNPTGDCVSGISSGQVGGATEWLVGDVFLKNVYYSTDVSNNQISLAVPS